MQVAVDQSGGGSHPREKFDARGRLCLFSLRCCLCPVPSVSGRDGCFFLLMAGFWTFFFIDLLKSDPGLLERRLPRQETEPEQKRFQRLFS
jgi:hypothetical protein